MLLSVWNLLSVLGRMSMRCQLNECRNCYHRCCCCVKFLAVHVVRQMRRFINFIGLCLVCHISVFIVRR